MSLANELQKLKSLRDSGGITADEYEKSRNRILEDCVRHIEAVHDLNPKVCVSGQPSAAQRSDAEPRVKFSRPDVRPEGNRASTYSGELDYSLVKPPVQRIPDSSPAPRAVAEAQVENTRIVPKAAAAAASVSVTPVVRAVQATVQDATARIIPPPVRVEEERPAQSWGVPAQRVEVSFSSRIEVFEKEEPAVAVAPSPQSLHRDANAASISLPPEVRSPSQTVELNDRVVEERVPRFGASYDSKPSGRDRWGLPRFKMVRGVVQDIRASMCQDSERYAASVEVDGQRVAITSPTSILIAAGDRISLGGYERDGELLVLAYRNETNGSYSDLSSLRKRYRFLLTIGRLCLLIGLAALAATLLVFLRKPVAGMHFEQLGYPAYVLSGLVAAAVSYLGLTLSFVGKWAKEFHNALAPAESSAEPAAYDRSSLPLATQ
jgi:Short C-terminal domain